MTSWWDETVFNISFEELKINSVYLLRIYPTGEIKTSLNYYDEIKSHFITPNIAFNEIITTPPPTVGINKAKLTDVKSLLKYVSPTSRAYFEDNFAKVGVKKPKAKVLTGFYNNDSESSALLTLIASKRPSEFF